MATETPNQWANLEASIKALEVRASRPITGWTLRTTIYGRTLHSYLRRPWTLPRALWKDWRSERCHKAERIAHCFSTRDIWGFCDSNAKAQVHALSELKAMNSGHPADLTNEQWIEQLDLMIDGWQAMIDLENYDGSYGVDYREFAARCDERFRTGMALYVDRYPSLWD